MSKHKPKKKKNQLGLNPKLNSVTDEEISLLRRDDLLEINHINPTIEIALNTIGLNTYDDFLNRTPEEIAKLLKQRAGITITARTISNEDWIGQAKKLSQNDPMPPAPDEQEPKETDNDTQAKSTIAQVEPAAGISPTSIPSSDQTDAHAISVTNSCLRIIEASFVPGEPGDEAIPKKLLSTVHCNLSETSVESLTEDSQSLCIQIHVLDNESHQAELFLSKSMLLNKHQTDYSIDFEVELIKAGYYRLQVIAFVITPKPKIAFYQGPWVRVIE